MFSPIEIQGMICGSGLEDPWNHEVLLQSTKFEHGYSSSSRVIEDMIDVLVNFTFEERKLFVLFLTGSPRLPLGGIDSLIPRFTVVRKIADPLHPADSMLPSVSSCFNILKLPEYSTKEILKRKLLLAITEGQNSFDLS
jgi:E3 ubiquitin-protein ligase TRIP12